MSLPPTPPKGRSATKDAVTPVSDEMRYRAQDAMHTIARAEAHKRDPELMRHVKALADDVHKAVGGSVGERPDHSNPCRHESETPAGATWACAGVLTFAMGACLSAEGHRGLRGRVSSFAPQQSSIS